MNAVRIAIACCLAFAANALLVLAVAALNSRRPQADLPASRRPVRVLSLHETDVPVAATPPRRLSEPAAARERPPLAAMPSLISPTPPPPPARPLAVNAPAIKWAEGSRARALSAATRVDTTAAPLSPTTADSSAPSPVDGEPVDADGGWVDEPPVETTLLRPRYPAIALRRKLEGTVLVELVVNCEGQVEDARIVRVDGHHAFARAVLDIAGTWRFRPALRRGEPVRVRAMKTVHFKLDGQ